MIWSGQPVLEAGVFALLEGSGIVGLPSTAVDAALQSEVEQNTETLSAFIELTWNINDSFRSIFGVRYSKDGKNIDKVDTVTSFRGDSPLPDAVLNTIYTSLNFYTAYAYQLDRGEDHVTGNLNFQYDVNDDIMTYLNFATGYKAGGFDAGNNTDRSREFEDEGVESIELGGKMTLWDGRARVNAAYFAGNYEDVQVSSWEGSGFVVGNAAETEVQGIEMDFDIAATESITINAAVAWLDATYADYPNGACLVADRLDGSCSSANPQDLTGATLQFAPEYSGNLGISYQASITDRLDLSMGADVVYSDAITIAPNQDARSIQGSYAKWNARIALESNDGQWSVALVGKNLTDETTFNWANDATLSGEGLGFDNAYFRQFEAPRTYEVQARYNFF